MDSEDRSMSRNIPKLDDSNYTQWSMQIKAHLRHKGLLQHCLTDSSHSLEGAALTAVKKKLNETVDILMNYLGNSAFNAIITPDNEGDPFLIWTRITKRYTSQSVNNKGRVWLKFMRYKYNGNLKQYISDCSKLINELLIF